MNKHISPRCYANATIDVLDQACVLAQHSSVNRCGYGDGVTKPEPTYDIFRKTSDQAATWVESVTGLEQAKKRMLRLASTTPGAYLLYDPRQAAFIEPFADSAP